MSKKKLSGVGREANKDKSAFVPQRDKIKQGFTISPRYQWTPRHQEIIDRILDKETKIVFVEGPAGTAKTLMGVYAGLHLLNDKKLSDIMYVRSIVESSSKPMGYLKGGIDDKTEPYAMPLNDKLSELISSPDIRALHDDNRIHVMPIGFVRGASWNAKYILADEAQNLDFKELTTLISRFGQFSKMVIVGDAVQSDINGKSGFMKMFDLFNDEMSRTNGIHCVSLTKDDVVRSGILKYVLGRIETVNIKPTVPTDWHPSGKV